MNDLAIIMKIKSVFEAGGNIIQYLNERKKIILKIL